MIRFAMSLNRLFVYVIFLLFWLPVASLANSDEQQMFDSNSVQSQVSSKAESVADKKRNMMPILKFLLFDEDSSPCNERIALGQTLVVEFIPECFDSGWSHYYKTYTFTIDQRKHVLTSFLELRSNSGYYCHSTCYFHLFPGSDTTGTYIGSAGYTETQVDMLNELDPGTYTIRILSYQQYALLQLSLSENNHETTAIDVGTTAQINFN